MPHPKQPSAGSATRSDEPAATAGADSARRPIAVAVHQGADGGAAPRIVASGRGAVAEQILGIAFETGVRVRADADLAEILAAVDVDCEIPLQALTAVAEILSYVYRANAGSPSGATSALAPEHEAPQ